MDPIRKAASVIVARDGREGVEVLVLERSVRSRFLPGYVAFPGGAADAEDAGHAERWFGSEGESARACAVRELLEEVGLVLTANGLGEAPERSVEAVDDLPPGIDQLPEIAHWVAPPQVPVRFDARYYAVASPADLHPEPDGVEIVRAWWASPRRLLDEWDGGRRKLWWPTYFTLQVLTGCRRAFDVLALRIRTREPDELEVGRLPRATFWQE